MPQSQKMDPVLDPLLSIEAFCFGATRARPQETEVDFLPHLQETIQLFVGNDILHSKNTAWESLFANNLKCLVDDAAGLMCVDRARPLCLLLEAMLVSQNFSHNELLVTLCAISSGVSCCFSQALSTLSTLVREQEAASTSENSNAKELETLQFHFHSLQQKCSALMGIHEGYKEEKEYQILDALRQCSQLKQQVEEAAAFSALCEVESARLTRALTQAEEEREAAMTSLKEEHMRREKAQGRAVHSLTEQVAALQRDLADTSSSAQEALLLVQQENKNVVEKLEIEKKQKLQDETRLQDELRQLRKIVDDQMSVFNALRSEHDMLQMSLKCSASVAPPAVTNPGQNIGTSKSEGIEAGSEQDELRGSGGERARVMARGREEEEVLQVGGESGHSYLSERGDQRHSSDVGTSEQTGLHASKGKLGDVNDVDADGMVNVDEGCRNKIASRDPPLVPQESSRDSSGEELTSNDKIDYMGADEHDGQRGAGGGGGGGEGDELSDALQGVGEFSALRSCCQQSRCDEGLADVDVHHTTSEKLGCDGDECSILSSSSSSSRSSSSRHNFSVSQESNEEKCGVALDDDVESFVAFGSGDDDDDDNAPPLHEEEEEGGCNEVNAAEDEQQCLSDSDGDGIGDDEGGDNYSRSSNSNSNSNSSHDLSVTQESCEEYVLDDEVEAFVDLESEENNPSLIARAEDEVSALDTCGASDSSKQLDITRNHEQEGEEEKEEDPERDEGEHRTADENEPAGSLAMPRASNAAATKEGGVADSSGSSLGPIILIDIGSFSSHVGVWNADDSLFEIRHSCPSVVARPASLQASATSLLHGASMLAGPMYTSFREHNAVAGEDAWYCAYTHPDAGLRGALTVSRPISSAGAITDAVGFKLLLLHCLSKLGWGADDSNWDSVDAAVLAQRSATVLVSHKVSFSAPEFKIIAEVVFEHFNAASMSLMSQPVLCSLGFGVPSLLVLDIGASSTRVLPVYESYCLTQYVESTEIGGEHLTDYMELLLHGQRHEHYGALPRRRRLQLARDLKEKHCFLASSFVECVENYGNFQFSYEKVMHLSSTDSRDDTFKCDEGSTTENTIDIEVTETFPGTDGRDVTVKVDRELFYCPEVLFSPYLHEACADEASIADIILASVSGLDDSVKSEIARTILVTGSSSQLRGLADRLQSTLSESMSALGVENFIVVTACTPDSPQPVNEVTWRGCAQTVSSALDANSASCLPNLITSADFDKYGEGAFPTMYS